MNNKESTARIVSSEDEELILVDEDDNEIGHLSKAACHDGDGVRHRAFSVFLFNDAGELLLQRRSAGKRLWPGYWSNSCCSHPRRGESMALAASRRLWDELHTATELEFVYRFAYRAGFGELGSEYELCSVFLGRLKTAPVPNETEIESVRYLPRDAVDTALATEPDSFTPWLKLEWQRLNEEFADALGRYSATRAAGAD